MTVFKKEEVFWSERFQSEDSPTTLSYSKATTIQNHASNQNIQSLQTTLPSQVSERMNAISKGSSMAMYLILLAGVESLLYTYTNADNMILGIPAAGSSSDGTVPLNEIVLLKNEISSLSTFKSLLSQIKSSLSETMKHQNIPFRKMASNLNLQYDSNGLPIVNTVVSFKNIHKTSFEGYVTSDLVFQFELENNSLHLELFYNGNYYEKDFIMRVLEHVNQIFSIVLFQPELELGKVDILSEDEKDQILKTFNSTRTSYPREKTIQQMFEEQVERSPDHVAVVFEDQLLTYRELNERANQLARTLRAKGVLPDQIVGIMADRSLEMMVGIFGILKAGGAYLPIDPNHPHERIRYLLEDSHAKLLLVQRHLEGSVSFAGDVVVLEEETSYQEDRSNLVPLSDSRNLAYVIYTSGSTGNPKGVMIEHHSVINRLLWMQEAYPISENDAILQKTAITFDVSVWELFWWSFVGSKVVLLPKGGEKNPEQILDTIATQQITTMHFVPAMLHAFLEYLEQQPNHVLMKKLPALRQVFTSGEALAPSQVARFHQFIQAVNQAQIINLYGPTEATVDVSYFDCYPEQEYTSVPIGKPIFNTQLYIVREGTAQLQPIGVAGELCIAGVGLARGYLHRPELTQEKFVENPFDPGERMYRTGDLAKWLPDGNIEYLGRIDHQVKIRGYRIELGEVEDQLLKIASIQETVVMAREDHLGQKLLCAYIVADQPILSSELREALSHHLPDYMIPSYFVQVERMPLSPNGKIDRKALPAPTDNLHTKTDYVAPRTIVEEQLSKIWQEVLGIERISVTDNFFDIGGHSLRATTLLTKVYKEMKRSLPLRKMFQHPTIEGMANLLTHVGQNEHTSIPVAMKNEYYPVSSGQKRLYILSQIEGGELSYNMPFVMKVDGIIDRERLESVLHLLTRRHESLRTAFAMVNGELVQQINTNPDFGIEYSHIREEDAKEYIRSFVRPFDLDKAPLLRVGLAKLEEHQHLLLFDMHHIISDGVSLSIFIQEFVQLYGGEQLAPLRIQYKDYAVWQQAEAQSERMKQQEAYWLEVFSDEIPVLDMPTDFLRPALQSYLGRTYTFVIDQNRSAGLRQLASQTGATMYMVLLAVYSTLLSKYSGQEDVVVGSPIAGRPHADVEGLIGVFINTLALRNYPVQEKSFLHFLSEVKEHALAAFENQEYPFEELVEKLNLTRDMSRNPLFDTMFAMQNMELGEWSIEGLQMTPYPEAHAVAKFDLTVNAREDGDQIVCEIEYATSLYKHETIERMAEHFLQLIDAVNKQPQATLSSLDIITSREKEQILHDFTYTSRERVNEKPIHQLFEEQAERNPDKIAVVWEDQQLTYRELNAKANQLARSLREKGVVPDQLVGIMADRSLEMIVGLIASLKAGGAYVPIDPDYPEDRIQYMLQDSGAKVLLLQGHLLTRVSFYTGDIVVLDEMTSYHEDGSNLTSIQEPDNLAYVIYTSGTTGKPKGVMIEHKQLSSMASAWKQAYHLQDGEFSLLQWASFSFDVFTGDYVRALFNGGQLILCPSQSRLDPALIYELIRKHRVTIFESTPAIVLPLMEYIFENKLDIRNLSTLIVGSDQCPPESFALLVERFGSSLRILNSYGVTEACIDSCYFEQTNGTLHHHLPIGKPLPNVQMYILDQNNSVQPVGVPGELYIGGKGVGRGYWNRPDLTAEKFVEHLFIPGERLYKTGDLAKWLPDGNIAYLGRMDHQVKIRGNRIELGEIEAQLLKIAFIKEAIVVAREYESGLKQLCAYIVAVSTLSLGEVRSALAEELPNYMIPSYFVQLEEMPLTANGKIDRKALPVPDGSMQSGTEYVAPRTEVERTLLTVWQSVLGVERIGIVDNFFELGGDSIKAIQVSSRLFQAGLKLEMKHLFTFPTVKGLSQHVHPISRIADQKEVSGAVTLTPIQNWFFEQKFVDLHHFNQAVMIYREDRFDESALRKTMQKLIEHHDALRMVFRPSATGNVAWNRGIEEGELFTLDIFDFREEANTAQAIEATSTNLQSSIDLEKGPLIKLGLFQCADGDHLLIAIHHLVIDGVSWRILFEDIATGYEQVLRGHEVTLPKKTDSFQSWAVHIATYANSSVMQKEKAYWREIEQSNVQLLSKDYELSQSLVQDSEIITVEWTFEETELLLKQSHRAFNTDMNDLLLTALGLAVHKWAGIEQIKVNLEGHGRESIIPDLDMTRTVGWFTSQYPVLLKIEAKKGLSSQIKEVKEGLRQIPQKGIGYGLFKYLSTDSVAVSFGPEPEISFNYLGQFDQDLQNSALQVSPYSIGSSISEKMSRPYVLDINGMVTAGILSMTIEYNGKEYHKETMMNFAGYLRESLREVIAHCVARERTELTPSDVLWKDVTVKELDQLIERTRHIGEIENIYALTPMQKGMLFHNLMDNDACAYYEQTTFTLHGVLDITSFRKSIQLLSQRHAILRTNFYYDWKEQPVQVVYRNRQIGFHYKDIREMGKEQREAYFQTMRNEDKVIGFHLEENVLMRVSILRTGEKEYRFLWSHHHILMDGWCMSLITKEVFDAYFAYQKQNEPELEAVTPYTDYITWLGKQDREAASGYWSDYLVDYEEQATLPKRKSHGSTIEYVSKKLVCDLNESLTQRIHQVAKQHQVTLNTFMQVVWGVLLQKYTNTHDVVFGSVVSGRPADILGIENMVGLFINTIPVRVRCKEETSVTDVLRNLQKQALSSLVYDTYPLYEIQSQTLQKQGLIDHIMVFENYPVEQQIEQLGDQERSTLKISNVSTMEQTNYNFNLIVLPGYEMKILMEYNESVYDTVIMENLRSHLLHLLEQIVNNPEIAVKDLTLISAEARSQLLEDFNQTTSGVPQRMISSQLFEEQVNRTPEQVALVFEDKKLTYRELNERANQLARTLRDRGIGTEQLVGIMVQRSVEMIIGILGIMKAGAAYLPIDPEYPVERIQYLLEDSEAKYLLLQQKLEERVSFFTGSTIMLDDEGTYQENRSNLGVQANLHDLAYVIYTSGTTGLPKGVMVEHQSIAQTVQWKSDYYGFTMADRVLTWTPFVFDPFLTHLFGPMISGATVYLLSDENSKDPVAIRKEIAQHQITHLQSTPSFLHSVVEHMQPHEFDSVKKITVGGEQFGSTLISKLFTLNPELHICNEYGPTENSVITSALSITSAEQEITIGKPIKNTQVYILGNHDQLQPVGIIGELCISGPRLARGYLNQPELTCEKFVDNPFVSDQRMYRTGDLARWLPYGSIEFIGRMDNQVKVRGYRIELGEVESRILNIDVVHEATVIATEDESGQNYLCAYFVADQQTSVSELRNLLSDQLPEYMIPSYFVQIDRMPLSPNGKIDRKALPIPDGSMQTGIELVAPRTSMEEQLSKVWQEVLGLTTISVKDNFFHIGGHSLRAMTLVAKLHKDLDIHVPLREVFLYPTIEQMASAISNRHVTSYQSIPVTEEKEYYPASSAQKRLYILSQLEGGEVSYNMPSIVSLEGAVDLKRMELSLQKLIERHETLRTSFEMVNGELVQRVSQHVDFTITYTESSEENAEELIRQFVQPFDLEMAPLLRVEVVKLKENRHLLLLDMHHIISDGVSMNVFMQEFVHLYADKELAPLRIQYKDFAMWQQAEAQSERFKQQEAYWFDVFRGEIPILDMPTDFPRPPVQSYLGEMFSFVIDEARSEGLRKLGIQTGATMYMVLLATYTTLLSKYSGQDDIVVGSPIAGRPHADVDGLIGVFINTLALRNYPEGEKTFLGYLTEVKERTLSAFENQDYPFEELVEKLDLNRDMSRNPLFDTMFSMQNMELGEWNIDGLQMNPYPETHAVAKFDLTVNAREEGDKIFCEIEYATAIFKHETIQRMAEHLLQLIDAINAHPENTLSALDMVSFQEKELILGHFNNTTSDHKHVQSIKQHFEEQVERTPDHIAVVWEDLHITYRELNKKANQLARTLQNKGVGPDQLVGIMADRSLEMMVGIIAILKAGGAYVPIDPSYPEERIQYMLEDSEAKVLLLQSELQKHISSYAGTSVFLDDELSYQNDGDNLTLIQKPEHLAYVIYTSGTTGKPKGVMIEHKQLSSMALAWKQAYHLQEGEVRLLQWASFSFDVFTGDYIRALFNGGQLILCPAQSRLDLTRIYELILKHRITIFESTPAIILPLMEYVYENQLDIHSLTTLIVGSDQCSPEAFAQLVERFGVKMRILNSYGVTEACIDSCFYEQTYETLHHHLPIGKPLPNVQMYILNKGGQIQPIGVPGELHIGGNGVGRGYWNRPELTTEKFVENPLASGECLYRTGDLARWRSDGNIEYIGRSDDQVKIRGNRIELGEVEAQVSKIASVKEAIVVAREDQSGQKLLCAYIVADTTLSVSGVRNALAQELPNFMIPSYMIQIEKIPLTQNGKVDRRALPAPEETMYTGTEYVAPRTNLETQLVKIWREVLGHPKIGVKDNFFDIGGHSLRATSLITKLHKELDIQLSLREVFQLPTIEQMAEAITGKEQDTYCSIPTIEEREYYPVSSAQKRLYILSQMEGAELSYNMPSVAMLEGPLDPDRLEKTVQKLIERHETLRTSFEMINGVAVQRVHASVKFALKYSQAREEDMSTLLQEFVRPFDLIKAPLLRIELVQIEQNRHILLFDTHHIISDGASTTIFMQEFVQLYSGEELSPLRIQYKDYVAWQQNEAHSDRLKKQETFWLDVFREEIPVLYIPTDYPRPAIRSFEGGLLEFKINPALTDELKRLVADSNSTLYMVLLAAYMILLSKCSGEEDIVVGTPIAGRAHADLDSLIGMFVNTLAIRSYPKKDLTVLEYLQNMKETALQAFENQDYPFEELVEKLQLARDFSRNPLFDTMFVWQNIEQSSQTMDDLTVTPYKDELAFAKFDLTLQAVEDAGGISCTLEYATSIFRPETVKRMSQHFLQVIQSMVDNPQLPLSALDMMSTAEKEQIRSIFNDTRAVYAENKTISQLLEEQVELAPDQMAIVYEDQKLTYREVNERSNQLARTLREKGVMPDQLVGLMAERSIEMFVGILGILKAGGAYLPIDPDYPEERIHYMLEDSGATLLLTQSHLRARVAFKGSYLMLDEEATYHMDCSNLETVNNPDHLAYVIYTSGTTGKPKGVMVEHHGVCNLKAFFEDTLRIQPRDKIVQFASLSFDASVWETMQALLCGATLCVPPSSVIMNYRLFEEFINGMGITVATLPPTYAAYLNPDHLTFLEKVITAGSAASVELVQKWQGRVEYFNAYGPTEDSICTTIWKAPKTPISNHLVPIGRPILNHQVYILDENNRLLPIGVAGEICISGVGLARGYLHRADLTSEKFVDHPFSPGERIYKTGDLARWLPDGTMEYLGRIDQQVKIRGYRIELGEVEDQLLRVASIQEAVVIAREYDKGQKYLCAYFVATTPLTVSELRNRLSQELPAYMIPSFIIGLEKMPLSPNGKIDRKALPAPEGGIQTGTDYVAPRTPMEAQLVDIWQEVLGIPVIGVRDNFFEIGGHSLKVLQLLQKIYSVLGMEISLQKVFELPTIEDMAHELLKYSFEKQYGNQILKLNENGPINVFCFPPVVGYGLAYLELAKELEGHCVLYGIEYIGDSHQHEEMLHQYVDSIVDIQGSGPYLFMGYSLGGNLAFEVAKIMEKRGLHVSDIIMIDSARSVSAIELSHDQLATQVDEIWESVPDSYRQFQTTPYLRDKIKSKISSYMAYGNQLINTGKVLANIHALVAVSSHLDKPSSHDVLLWKDATQGNYEEYTVIGHHEALLEAGYVVENAKVAQLIVKKSLSLPNEGYPVHSK